MKEILESVEILNGLMVDLCTTVLILRDYEGNDFQGRGDVFRQGIYRVCTQTIFLNCAKYTEFCRDYGKIVNLYAPDKVKLMNKYKVQIEERGINSFRNDYIGHIRSKKLKRPLTVIETDAKVASIMGGEFADDFLNWICPEEFESLNTETYLSGAITEIRDCLQKSYNKSNQLDAQKARASV